MWLLPSNRMFALASSPVRSVACDRSNRLFRTVMLREPEFPIVRPVIDSPSSVMFDAGRKSTRIDAAAPGWGRIVTMPGFWAPVNVP